MGLHKNVAENNLHETKGASTATKGQTLVANGVGAALFQKLLTNTVFVNTITDLPTAAGGKHTLLAGTTYLFGNSVDIGTNYLSFAAGTTIMSLAPLKAVITYTGTSPMLQGIDVNATVSGLSFNCPSADLFAFSQAGTGGTSLLLLEGILIIDCLAIGVFDKMGTIVLEGLTALNCATGISILGIVTKGLRQSSVSMTSTNTSFIGYDVTGSVIETVNMSGIILRGGAGSIGIKGDAGSANIAANFVANVETVQFQGVTTPLSGVTLDDKRWNFQSNGGLGDTMPDGLLSMVSNAVATVIAGVNTPTLVLGTWTCERQSQFTCSTAGRFTYNGERGLTTPIDVVLTIDPVSGTNKTYRAYVAYNGTVIVNSGKAIRVDAGNPAELTLIWQKALAENDYLEVYIENNTDAVDVTIIDATLRVN